MSGHSKWSTIKRQKAATDQKRGQVFSRLAKEITVAAKMGGGDPNMNPRLRTAIATAKKDSMPNDNIERAIKKGTGELQGEAYEELVYEGYGPGGVAILVETATDNKNRTGADMRHAFNKFGGNMATSNAVAWMFHRKGYIAVPLGATSEDALMEAGLDAGLEDIQAGDEVYEITTPYDKLNEVDDALKAAGIESQEAKLTFLPENHTPVTDEATASQLMRLLGALDDLDDVQAVHANFEMSPELMEAAAG
ncbi:MAG: YebC/PmpR family DNA-binding transcriptional regulator [Verrucomicrobiota bacterium]